MKGTTIDVKKEKSRIEADMKNWEKRGTHFKTVEGADKVLEILSDKRVSMGLGDSGKQLKNAIKETQKSGKLVNVIYRGLVDVDEGVHYYSIPHQVFFYTLDGKGKMTRTEMFIENGD